MYAAMCSQRGFALLEVLVATTIVAVALAGLAQLFVMSTNANSRAKSTTLATVLAIDKMEQLRSLMWGFDSLGLPLSDPRLAASPSSALRQNIVGFCDFLNKAGQSVGEGRVPPLGTIYVRRWSIEPLPADPGNVLVLQVLVTQRFPRDISDGANRSRLPDEARLVSIKARKAP
jgi:prepilin-type N-terminal cleavage/methylation domain-containing protein